jgi:hypothetical protein
VATRFVIVALSPTAGNEDEALEQASPLDAMNVAATVAVAFVVFAAKVVPQAEASAMVAVVMSASS